MTKILVKKSAPKGVLIKKKVDQQLPNDQGLFQTPDRGKSLVDFARTAFGPRRTESKVGVKPTARLAALAGLAGKGIAGVGAVNETMNAMQGGNISAPLGIGYSYERLDPTGRMISDYADPTLSVKPPTLSNASPAKFNTGAALKDITRGPVGKPITLPSGKVISADDPLNTMPIGGSAYQPMNYSQTPHMQNVNAGMSLPQADRVIMQNQPAGPIQAQRPVTQPPVSVSNTAVPGAVASNVTPMPISQTQPPGYPGNQTSLPPPPQPQLPPLNQALATLGPQPPAASFTVSPNQPVSYTGNLPQPTAITNPYANVNPQVGSMVQNLTSGGMTGQGPVNPNNQQAMLNASKNMGGQLGTQLPQNNQPAPVAPQQPGQVTPPGDQGMFVSPEEFHQNQLMQNKSFVTALTEKLGADMVYKMTPHQMGSFAAYTLLKLR